MIIVCRPRELRIWKLNWNVFIFLQVKNVVRHCPTLTHNHQSKNARLVLEKMEINDIQIYLLFVQNLWDCWKSEYPKILEQHVFKFSSVHLLQCTIVRKKFSQLLHVGQKHVGKRLQCEREKQSKAKNLDKDVCWPNFHKCDRISWRSNIR